MPDNKLTVGELITELSKVDPRQYVYCIRPDSEELHIVNDLAGEDTIAAMPDADVGYCHDNHVFGPVRLILINPDAPYA